ncbi:unnamed protein product, partial [Trichobilharzia regenti]
GVAVISQSSQITPDDPPPARNVWSAPENPTFQQNAWAKNDNHVYSQDRWPTPGNMLPRNPWSSANFARPQCTWPAYENHPPQQNVWPSCDNSVSLRNRWEAPESQSYVNQFPQTSQNVASVSNSSDEHHKSGIRQLTHHSSSEIVEGSCSLSASSYEEPYSTTGNAYSHATQYQRRWGQDDDKNYNYNSHSSGVNDYHHSHNIGRQFSQSATRPFNSYNEPNPRFSQSSRDMWPRNSELRQPVERFPPHSQFSDLHHSHGDYFSQVEKAPPRYISPTRPLNSEVENDQFHRHRDKDYRVTQDPPVQSTVVGDSWRDVDIRPVQVDNTSDTNPAIFPSASNKSKDGLRPVSLIPTPIELGCKPRGRNTHLPVPEHLLSAFEEAAASTGAWPPKGLDLDQAGGPNAKPRALPAWLRDELDKLEKKKAKELASVSSTTGAAPNAKRDDEGDIVMEDETKADSSILNPPLPSNNERSDDDESKEGENLTDVSSSPVNNQVSPYPLSSPGIQLVEPSEGSRSPKTVVKQLATINSQSILSDATKSITVSLLKLVSEFQFFIITLLLGV